MLDHLQPPGDEQPIAEASGANWTDRTKPIDESSKSDDEVRISDI